MSKLLKLDGSKVYATGDLHISHKNICRGVSQWKDLSETRDFASVDEMNEAIVDSIIKTVPEDGYLLNVGDILFGDKSKLEYWMERINRKQIFCYGNHDSVDSKYWSLFFGIGSYHEVLCSDRTGKYRLVCLFHYPLKSWNQCNRGSIALTGHEHGHMPYEDHERGLDVGWDVFKRPISFYEICDLMDKKISRRIHHAT